MTTADGSETGAGLVRRSPAPVEREARVLLGLAEDAPAEVTVIRPGRAVIVSARDGAWFVKRDAPAVLDREIAAAAAAPYGYDGSPPAPVCLARSTDGGLAAFEGLVGWTSLHALHEQGDLRLDDRLAHLGQMLARLHAAPAPVSLPNATPPLAELLTLDVDDLAHAVGETPALVAELQHAPGLEAALRGLGAVAPSGRRLVHGDLKLDNVMAGPGPGQLRLVDWELAGAGDPAWDLGSALGDLMFRWLSTVRPAPGTSLATWLRDTGIALDRARDGAAALLGGYAAQAHPLPDRLTVARYVGVFLLHRALAFVERHGRFAGQGRLFARIGAQLLICPQAGGVLIESRAAA
jgi:hypothetical protein